MFAVSGKDFQRMRTSQRIADRLVLAGVVGGGFIALLGLTSAVRAEPAASVVSQIPAEVEQVAMLAQMLAAPDTAGFTLGSISHAPLVGLMAMALVTMVAASAAFASTLRTDYAVRPSKDKKR